MMRAPGYGWRQLEETTPYRRCYCGNASRKRWAGPSHQSPALTSGEQDAGAGAWESQVCSVPFPKGFWGPRPLGELETETKGCRQVCHMPALCQHPGPGGACRRGVSGWKPQRTLNDEGRSQGGRDGRRPDLPSEELGPERDTLIFVF